MVRHTLAAVGWCTGVLLAAASAVSTPEATASSIDQLTDLTGKAQAIVTFKGRDVFTSEYRYDISVRNNTPDPLIADSLVVVLDKITNIAGEEREPLKSETLLSRFDVFGQDGETADGKPFFRIPPHTAPDLSPQAESRPVSVRLRNRDYVAVFTPVFRVYGTRRPPPEPAPPTTSVQPPTGPHQAEKKTDRLIQLLIKKGLITQEEWQKANTNER
jgi:hypothetical protein